MPKHKIDIPKAILLLNPGFSSKQVRAWIMKVLNSKANRMRQADIFNIKLPGIGVMRSRGNKRPKRRQSVLKKDRERKRKLAKNNNKL